MKNKILVLSIVFFAMSIPSFAYLDPGTGSYLFQLMIAFIVGAGYSIKVFWKDIISFFYKLFVRDNKNDEK